MPLAPLAAGDIPGYLQHNADCPDATWLFLHIPKTAGSSFRGELARRLRPEANITVDYRDDSRPHNVKLAEAIDRFIANSRQSPVRFASGHLLRPMMARVEAGLAVPRLVTMLRDPVARVVSDYRYQCTPQHPPHRQFVQRFPRLEDYVEAPDSQNKMLLFLRRDPAQTVGEVIADIDQTFAFVGITELYELSFRLLMALLGEDAGPTVFERRTQDVEHNRIANLAAIEPRIRELNRGDGALYRHFRQRLEQRHAVILTQLRRLRAQRHRAAVLS